MAEPDDVIHQQNRLKIMSALNALKEGEWCEFMRLRAVVQATDGNLGTHLATLEKAGYVAIKKEFVGKKPRTSIAITRVGRKAFAAHVDFLREMIGDTD
jgi:DNA-binding transcriptional ArsR family regulator